MERSVASTTGCYDPTVALDLFASLLEVTATLERSGVEYALVGGLAVAVHGAPRATADIDLLVRPDDADNAIAAAKAAGFDFEALPQQFSDGMRLRRVTRVSGGESLTLDFILADDALASAFESRERYAAGDGEEIWVISRDALIAMKIAAGRAKDLADVERLKEQDR